MTKQEVLKQIKAIYDDGGKTIDRFIVYYKTKADNEGKYYDCLAVSNEPFHPQGFCQHSSGILGRHNGKRIAFDNLPLDCQKAVIQDFRD